MEQLKEEYQLPVYLFHEGKTMKHTVSSVFIK